jgi:CheY-like chemotaxis protein
MNPILLLVNDEPAGQEALESVLLNQGYTLAFASHGAELKIHGRHFDPLVASAFLEMIKKGSALLHP